MSVCSEKKAKNFFFDAIIVVLTLFITFVRSVYSPVYRYVTSPDSICYKIIASGVCKGLLPYKDLFDHKGPLFFDIYALGLLLFSGKTAGLFFIACVINVLSIIAIYRTSKLRYSDSISFCGLFFVLLMCSLGERSILFTFNAPDNFLLLPLAVSAYVLCKDAKKQNERFETFSLKSVFINGIMCGTVLMIKLNVCFYYFAFIGCYFLWLIIKRKVLHLFKSIIVFLSGIIIVAMSVLIPYFVTDSIKEFWDAYIVFNIRYSRLHDSFWIFKRGMVTDATKLSFSIMILFALIAFVILVIRKRASHQIIVTSVLLAIVCFALTINAAGDYFYIVFFPIYLLGVNEILVFLHEREVINLKKITVVSFIMAFLTLIMNGFLFFNLLTETPIREDDEKKIIAYSKNHKDAHVLYAACTCRAVFSDVFIELPSTRLFYMPNRYTDELLREQMQCIKEQKAEIVVLALDKDDATNELLDDYISKCGYNLYTTCDIGERGYPSAKVNMYVLD